MIPKNQGFNLSVHTDLFTKSKGTDKYICPICGGNDLSIHKSSGKYNCYSSSGDCNKEIYKFVINSLGIDSKENDVKVIPQKIGIDFYSSNSLKETAKQTYDELISYQSDKSKQVIFPYKNLNGEQCSVIRKDYSDKAKSKPHTYQNNKFIAGKFDINWHPFNNDKFSLAKDKSIIITEGEKDATIAQYFTGILSTCLVCGGNKYEQILLFSALEKANIKSAIYFYDNDDTGKKKAIKLKAIADTLGFDLTIIPISYLYPDCPDKADLSDYFMNEDISEYLKSKTHLESVATKYKNEQCSTVTLTKIKSIENKQNLDKGEKKDSWINQATNELFTGEWISLAHILYHYDEGIYKEIEEGIIIKKINNWCRNYIDEKGNKSKSNPSSVKSIFEWIHQQFYISPKQVNCDGIPLKNGYLAINNKDGKINFELKEYSPSVYFTYQSEVNYDPTANKKYATQLLECLDDPYKKLLIESIATILDLKLIRKKWDRIKGLMLIGDGSNGKDTLREVLSLILGKKGITGCSLNDFSKGDNGRGFNLLRLATNPKINWSSENKQINIDSIQTLKQSISGDPIFIEGKGKDGFEIELSTLFIFNTNDKPDIQANQKAISSRLTLIPFTKTYSTNPKKGELKANPRFKHDKEFLINEVCPAFLNLLINSFNDVYQEGIDYGLAEDYFEKIITDNNHLRRFANDIGLTFTGEESDKMSIKDIYGYLTEWYHSNGYLEFEEMKNGKIKNSWLDEGRKSDPVIKRPRDLKGRLLTLYPLAKILEGRNIQLSGLKMISSNLIFHPDDHPTCTLSTLYLHPKSALNTSYLHPNCTLNNQLDSNDTNTFNDSLHPDYKNNDKKNNNEKYLSQNIKENKLIESLVIKNKSEIENNNQVSEENNKLGCKNQNQNPKSIEDKEVQGLHPENFRVQLGRDQGDLRVQLERSQGAVRAQTTQNNDDQNEILVNGFFDRKNIHKEIGQLFSKLGYIDKSERLEIVQELFADMTITSINEFKDNQLEDLLEKLKISVETHFCENESQ